MYAKMSVISVILKPFIPHDSSLIISVTCLHSSILSLLKQTFVQFLQTHLRFLDKIIL